MSAEALNYVDYAVIAVVVLSTIFAFIRGFLGSVLSLTGWIASIYLAYTLFPTIKPLIAEKVNSPIIVIVLGHVGLLICFLIVFGVFNIIATSAVKSLTSGIIDRTLGAGFGAIRGAIIMSFFFLVATTTIAIFHGVDHTKDISDDAMPKWLTKAKTYPYLRDGGSILASFIPDSFYERFEDMYADISKKSVDDRFVDNAIQRLRSSISKKEVNLIDERVGEEAATKSNEEIKYMKLQELLKANHDSKEEALSKDDISRLRKIIAEKQKELKQHPSVNADSADLE